MDPHPQLWDFIAQALSIVNPDKAIALSEHVRGAEDLPDELRLWSETHSEFILPRGFAHRLEQAATVQGITISWDSTMVLRATAKGLPWRPVELRGYQADARDELLDWASGIMQAPTGAGKTRVALEVARWAGQDTLIIVDKTALAKQWLTTMKESYGYEAGLIGDGSWSAKMVTVALRQSLWSRREAIPAEFWERWGMVVVDEVHHASAETLVDLLQRFPAFYRLGYSATPIWDPELFPFIEATVGPVIHRTTAADVGEVLVKPSVRLIKTGFEFQYIGTFMKGHRRVQNNYSEMMGALCSDPQRNFQIAEIAAREASAGHHVLVTTRRIEHVKAILARLQHYSEEVSIFELTGKQSRAYEKVRTAIASATRGTITVSTIADEALDIPRLDRLVMAFPARRVPLVEQQVGRIMRAAPGKTDAIVYDILDDRVGVIKSQYRERQQQLYMRRRWSVYDLSEVG